MQEEQIGLHGLYQLIFAYPFMLYAQYTFKPHISECSLHITEGLGTSCFVRQQKHMEKRQEVVCGVSGMCVGGVWVWCTCVVVSLGGGHVLGVCRGVDL